MLASRQTPDSSPGQLTQEIAQTIDDLEHTLAPDAGIPEPQAKRARTIQVEYPDEEAMHFRTIHEDCSFMQLRNAELDLGTIDNSCVLTDVLGVPINLDGKPEPFQVCKFQIMADHEARARHPLLHSAQSCSRMQMLRKQGPWVALDEMTHYLEKLQKAGTVTKIDPVHVSASCLDDELKDKLQAWFVRCSHHCHQVPALQVASAMLIHDHWVPVLFRPAVNSIHVLTTEDGHDWIDAASRHLPKMPTVRTTAIETRFPNDCGFQCVAWLLSKISCADTVEAFEVDTAVTWRQLFEHKLCLDGIATEMICPEKLPCGGATGDITQQLVQLLTDHGVPSNQVQNRAAVVIDKIGRVQLSAIMRSPAPWKDLKAAANQCSPKLQLVLATEMQAAIDARLQDPTPLGNRKKKTARQAKGKIELQPEDIHIPDGLFKQGDGEAVGQINTTQIGPQAKGVVVLTSIQAVPYLKASRPLSSSGLALLILDHEATMLHGCGELIRFPAHCCTTGEPLLLTAKMVQLGNSPISRIQGTHVPRIDEVPNSVLKAMIYRDEMQQGWDDFQQHPVHWLISQFPELATTKDSEPKVLDCWDRQMLSSRLERTRPDRADIYVVSLRLAGIDTEALMQKSGHKAIYFEPRTEDGRRHDEMYRVIWLSKTDRSSALMSVQATTVWACLVRSGNRFGIRVHAKHAAEVHQVHKPQVPYLEGVQLDMYLAGPFPWGATRASLSKLFGVWKWPARPVQPRGRSADNSGIMWLVQASAAPQYEVFQVEHADVLITQLPKKQKMTRQAKTDVHASAKTLAALTRQIPMTAEAPDSTWVHGGPDPWGPYQPVTKAPRAGNATSSSSTEALEQRIEARIMQSIAKNMPTPPAGDDDAPMTSAVEETRIAVLEAKLVHLENTVQMNQITQEQNHLEVTGNVTKLQTQVETQAGQLQRHFDQRMQEQLDHIERLLNKKRAGESWLHQRTLLSVGLTLLLHILMIGMIMGLYASCTGGQRECGLLPFKLPDFAPFLLAIVVLTCQLGVGFEIYRECGPLPFRLPKVLREKHNKVSMPATNQQMGPNRECGLLPFRLPENVPSAKGQTQQLGHGSRHTGSCRLASLGRTILWIFVVAQQMRVGEAAHPGPTELYASCTVGQRECGLLPSKLPDFAPFLLAIVVLTCQLGVGFKMHRECGPLPFRLPKSRIRVLL